MTHLAIHNKINLLPLNLLAEVEDYVDFLLQKYQKIELSNQLETDADSLTLEQIQQLVLQTIPPEQDLANELIAERRQEAKYE
ncbi:hypothetical protein BGP_4899 [Beggiatoa sp. PS]|nr:hypothetical protein BGP_4899 [Beggiatoa sp. PS]